MGSCIASVGDAAKDSELVYIYNVQKWCGVCRIATQATLPKQNNLRLLQ